MTKDGNRLIGDILEINSDIVNKRINSKLPKILTNIQEYYYRRKLNKSINKFKKLYLNKFNLQELFSYILTYYEGKYKSIQKIKISNLAEDTITTVDIYVNLLDINPMIPSIRYTISIDSKPDMNIVCSVHSLEGVINTFTVKTFVLFYIDPKKSKDIEDFTIKTLNDELINILIEFLNEHLSRFKSKGYMKEVNE